MLAIGIDLGATCARAAMLGPEGAPLLCPDHDDPRDLKTPSVVHIGADAALVGRIVEELLDDTPSLPTIREIKPDPGNTAPRFVDPAGRSWHADAVAALVMKKLARDARAFGNAPIATAVLTAPASAPPEHYRALKTSASLAGFGHHDVVAGPVAAAAYHRATGGTGRRLIVVDVGGECIDCALVEHGDEGFRVLAAGGATGPGGLSVENAIMRRIADQFRAVHGVDLHRDPASVLHLRRAAEAIRTTLGGSQPPPLARRMLLIGRKVLSFGMTREQFAALAEDTVQAVVQVCERLLREPRDGDSGMPDAVLLTGGARGLPGLQARLSRIEGISAGIVEREHAIVFGAALLAGAALERHGGAVAHGGSRFDIGMRVWNSTLNAPDVSVLIPSGSPLPTRRTTTLYTRRVNQERIVLELVRRDPADGSSESLGSFAFGPLRNKTVGHPIEIHITLDTDGVVKATASDPKTRQAISQFLADGGRGEGGDIDRLARTRELIAHFPVNE